MRILLTTLLFISVIFACSGDCLQCHPVLKKSINEEHHVILKTCINCHAKGSEKMSVCGGDCFDCHKKQKLIQSDRFEHRQIKTCKKCHIGKDELLNVIDRSYDLIDILNQK